MPEPAADGTAAPTVTDAGAHDAQPEGDWKALADEYKRQAEEYKDRFNGMQGKYQQELAKWTETRDGLSGKVQTLEAQLQNITGEREGFEAQLQAAQTDLEKAQGELDIKGSQLERLQLLTSKFPELLPYEYGGPDHTSLLPDGTGEALEAQLTAFKNMLGEQGRLNALEALEGVTPPQAPKGDGDLTRDEQWANVLAAMGTENYDSEYSKWLELES